MNILRKVEDINIKIEDDGRNDIKVNQIYGLESELSFYISYFLGNVLTLGLLLILFSIPLTGILSVIMKEISFNLIKPEVASLIIALSSLIFYFVYPASSRHLELLVLTNNDKILKLNRAPNPVLGMYEIDKEAERKDIVNIKHTDKKVLIETENEKFEINDNMINMISNFIYKIN